MSARFFYILPQYKINLSKLGRGDVKSMQLYQNTFCVHGDESSGSIKTAQFVDQMINYIFINNHCIFRGDIHYWSSIIVTARWTSRHLLNCIFLLSHVALKTQR